jgi:nucleotide-binding universal stress UspA family protein
MGRDAERAEGKEYVMRPVKPDGHGPVVCGVDHGPQATAGVPVAARLAGRLGAPFLLVHVAPLPVVLERPMSSRRERIERQRAVERAGHLHVVLEHVDVDARIEVERSVEFGHVPDELRAVAAHRRASLLVVGSRGHGALDRVLLGSTSRDLARRAPCPVVVVPPGAGGEPPLGSDTAIVCGVDGSPHAEDAVRSAAWLAARLPSHLQLVHVADDRDDAPALADALELARAAEPRVSVDQESVRGQTADALIAAAERRSAELLVIGSRGRGALRTAVLGSVSTALMARADCPVVVVTREGQA